MRVISKLLALLIVFGGAASASGFDYTFNEYSDKTNQSSESYCHEYVFLDKGEDAVPEKSNLLGDCSLEHMMGLWFPADESSVAESEKADKSGENSLLPDPEVHFVEDYMLTFDKQGSRQTIFLGGMLPFVALPDSDLVTHDNFLNEDSVSFFLYFKRKF